MSPAICAWHRADGEYVGIANMWNLADKGARIALVEGERQYTYPELDGLCRAIAAPIKRRSLVFCLCALIIKLYAASFLVIISFVCI